MRSSALRSYKSARALSTERVVIVQSVSHSTPGRAGGGGRERVSESETAHGVDLERANATWSTSSFTSYHGQLLSLAVQWGVAIEIERAIKKSARFC